MNKLIIPVCQYCRCSEEESESDVVQGEKCKLSICLKCMQKNENELCENCGNKLKDHLKDHKLKNHFTKECIEEGSKHYIREKDKRGKWMELQIVNYELSHLLAFYDAHDRQFYSNCCREIKSIQERQQNIKNPTENKGIRRKDFFPIEEINGGDGAIPCGAPTLYTKGIAHIFQAFRFKSNL